MNTGHMPRAFMTELKLFHALHFTIGIGIIEIHNMNI